MARPLKEGLDYFPFDVAFFSDKKIRRLKTKYGRDGICVYIYLLCKVYGDKGYYLECDDDLILDVSDDLDISEELTRQIMKYLLSRSLLCVCQSAENGSKLAESVTILSAKSIQRRYMEAKRKVGEKRDVFVKAGYWLLEKAETLGFVKVCPDESYSGNNESFSEKKSNKSAKNYIKESKGKESRVNESKVEESEGQAPNFLKPPQAFKVRLTAEQYTALTQKYPKHIVDDYIQRMEDYCQSKGKSYPDCVMTISRWIDEDVAKGKTTLDKPNHDTDDWQSFAMNFNSSMLGNGKD